MERAMFSTLTKIPCWTLFGLALFLLFLLHEANADNRIEVAGDGTDVVLIPGLASDGAALRSVTEHLGQCHRTHTLTLAGFAGQPAVDGPVLETRADSISKYIASLDSHRATLIG